MKGIRNFQDETEWLLIRQLPRTRAETLRGTSRHTNQTSKDEQTEHGFARHDKQLAAKGSAQQEHDCTRGRRERRFSSRLCAKNTQNLPLRNRPFHLPLHKSSSIITMTIILFLALFLR
jgi:hypothetical protein